jgi:hypothetical protein
MARLRSFASLLVLLPSLWTAGSAHAADGEWLSYRDAYRSMVPFEKWGRPKQLVQQHLQVMPRAEGVSLDGVQLALAGTRAPLTLPLDAAGRATLPLVKSAYDDNAVLVLNRKPGDYQFRVRLSIVARADGVYDLAELRQACEQALGYLRERDRSMASRQCVGVRFSFQRKAGEAPVRWRRASGEQALPASEGAPYPDEPGKGFAIVQFRFGAQEGQLLVPHAPVVIAPIIE